MNHHHPIKAAALVVVLILTLAGCGTRVGGTRVGAVHPVIVGAAL